ncbi:unnamed protein product [Rhodiola kirilowii]
MPGLNPKIALHRLAIKRGVGPKKQSQRRFRPELVPEIEKEVNKLIDADFIREVKYPTWIANIVPVRKKNGQLRVCVDFRDLNEACPKDDFPLPVTELMIDATTGHEALSFMDCTAGYNQIHMAPEDQDATAFRTPKGIFCYKVMPFGLKNAGATYQRAMQKIFEDMMHKTIECYVDDVVVKSKARSDHVQDLRTVFERLRKCQLKMNPHKCAFGVTSGKFLGFVVTHRGIEIDQTKIKAIQEMPEPKSMKELRGLQGRLAYIRRFISNLAGRCQPFSHLMKKDAPFVWDDKCRKAFDSIKKYLSTAPVLGAPIPGKPLILYVVAQEKSLGAMCAQETDERKERPLYYLSRTLVGAELNYSPIEKICLALYILSRPVLSGRLAKWAMLLKQYDLVFVPQRATKGQAIADFFADHPVPAKWEFSIDLPGEDIFYIDVLPPWQMFFDGAAVTLREVKKENVVEFITKHIIYRHGVPQRIVTDNGKQFSNKLMTSLCEKFKFKQYKSSMYNAPANGLAEAFNMTLCNLLRKVVGKSKRDWHEKIGEALWAYRTTYKTPTQATPYALVYGVEAVLPLELQIPSMRIAIQEGLSSDENDKLRLAELEALDEKRLQAQQSLQCYQARLSRAFNKKVRPRSFQKGDLVLAVRRPIITSHKTGSKFKAKWDGPYVVQEAYTNGAYKIVDQEGLRVGPINGKFLKRYYS